MCGPYSIILLENVLQANLKRTIRCSWPPGRSLENPVLRVILCERQFFLRVPRWYPSVISLSNVKVPITYGLLKLFISPFIPPFSLSLSLPPSTHPLLHLQNSWRTSAPVCVSWQRVSCHWNSSPGGVYEFQCTSNTLLLRETRLK